MSRQSLYPVPDQPLDPKDMPDYAVSDYVDRYGINRPDTGACPEHGCFTGDSCYECSKKERK